jgi:DNA-binding transcriptional MerR regulator
MNFEIYRSLQEKLEETGTLTFKELKEILDAFQIASGQGFAIAKTKAILDYLKKGNALTIENFNNSGATQTIQTKEELASIYKNLDEYVDLKNDKDFKDYF